MRSITASGSSRVARISPSRLRLNPVELKFSDILRESPTLALIMLMVLAKRVEWAFLISTYLVPRSTPRDSESRGVRLDAERG